MVHRVNFVTCSSSTSRFEELFRFRRSKFGFGLHPAVSFNKPGYQSINLGIYADFGRSMFQESQTKSHFHDFHDDIREKCLILKSKNKTTMVARPIARAVCSHEKDIWTF